jgi:ribosomal protein S18 acetylase RimI-like enzyme
MRMRVREFRRDDGDRVREFWVACGIRIRPGDDDDSLEAFAVRNPGLFLLADDDARIVGSALGGWDGRRGWLYQVAVRPDARRRGIASDLVGRIEARLREMGCPKVNLIVWEDNAEAMRFWEELGYLRERTLEYGKFLSPER